MKRVAMITGGSRGIGFGISKQLIRDGFSIAVVTASPRAVHQDRLADFDKMGADYFYVQGDVSVSGERIRCMEEIIKHFGRVDVLVNNAGVAPKDRMDLLDMEEESFDRLISINTKSVMFLSQLVAKQMLKQGEMDGIRGVIVNISSMSAEVSSVNRGEYCVSKAGVSMLTKLYADRLAKESIYVYEVRPGIIATDMTAKVKEKYDRLFGDGICPIGRWGTPEDVGNAVSLFCSGKLKYTTGQCIDVDGGFHISRL